MKILIVDDSKLLQMRILKLINGIDKDMEIIQAFNCMEASKLFSSNGPDAVVLDIQLPDGSGIDLLLKFKKENPAVNVIMFTNYPTLEFRKSCMDLGARDFIDKSDLTSLLKALELLKSHIN